MHEVLLTIRFPVGGFPEYVPPHSLVIVPKPGLPVLMMMLELEMVPKLEMVPTSLLSVPELEMVPVFLMMCSLPRLSMVPPELLLRVPELLI